MRLNAVQVTNFRSVEDSGKFNVGNMTCLVGKNEAGKTALLSALYGLNPYGTFIYDKTRDYPRRFVSDFDERHPEGRSIVVNTSWALDDTDVAAVAAVLGDKALIRPVIGLTRGIGYEKKEWEVPVDDAAALAFLVKKHELDAVEQEVLKGVDDAKAAAAAIAAQPQQSPRLQALLAVLTAFRDQRFSLAVIDLLAPRLPKFFLTSHFERMSGEVSITALAAAKAANTLDASDRIFLDFLAYAGTSVEELLASTKLEELKAKCEGASNKISDEIFEFWTQNDALSVKIDIAAGLPEDEPPMNAGNVAKAWITNRHHRASVPLSERSAGFVWFFSFLAQFKQLKKTTGNAIILLDEPGLTLHGRAQADLLRYIEERLLPNHQVIFTTHSPFMVPSDRLADVLIVEDVVHYDQRQRAKVEGTKVRDDVLMVSKDTLFPLQGALGYDLTQSLFVGKNTLLVEGPSDVLYLQALSSALTQRKRTGLDPRWTLCPGGGIDKIASFASLFGSNRLNMAVLCDIAIGDKKKIEGLRKHQLLQADHVFTIADFTGQEEGDVEDLFPHEKYAELLNDAYGLKARDKLTAERLQAADTKTHRVVKQAEAAFRVMPAEVDEFDHFAPSGWLIRNPAFLDAKDADTATLLDRAEQLFKTFNALLEKA
ncbi:AAA family ATPase [Paraburkholderia aspalathi]|uniref:AAA ATPase domain-containing protein n=1 Tax=Paraburkholderia aspalathi TaxID=1324617 RepID=A0A1I7EQ16_9BURK|nr:AAA family ATPase [Paraburkholderia aspalathi]SFU26016.1 AAA ATPase domain-containing protein [Paraburkholderia aspalathi]